MRKTLLISAVLLSSSIYAEDQTTLLSIDQAVKGDYPHSQYASDHPAGLDLTQTKYQDQILTYYGRARDDKTGSLISQFSRMDIHQTESLVSGDSYTIEVGIGRMLIKKDNNYEQCEAMDCTNDYLVSTVTNNNFDVVYEGTCLNRHDPKHPSFTKIWSLKSNAPYSNSDPNAVVKGVKLAEGQYPYEADNNYPFGTCSSLEGGYMLNTDGKPITACGVKKYNAAENYYYWPDCITQPELTQN